MKMINRKEWTLASGALGIALIAAGFVSGRGALQIEHDATVAPWLSLMGALLLTSTLAVFVASIAGATLKARGDGTALTTAGAAWVVLLIGAYYATSTLSDAMSWFTWMVFAGTTFISLNVLWNGLHRDENAPANTQDNQIASRSPMDIPATTTAANRIVALLLAVSGVVVIVMITLLFSTISIHTTVALVLFAGACGVTAFYACFTALSVMGVNSPSKKPWRASQAVATLLIGAILVASIYDDFNRIDTTHANTPKAIKAMYPGVQFGQTPGSQRLSMQSLRNLDADLAGYPSLRDKARGILDSQGYVTHQQRADLLKERDIAETNVLFRNDAVEQVREHDRP